MIEVEEKSNAGRVVSLSCVQGPDETDKPNADCLIDLPGILRRIPVGRSTIFKWRKDGTFPPGRKVGPRRRMWTEREVDAFVAGLYGPPYDEPLGD